MCSARSIRARHPPLACRAICSAGHRGSNLRGSNDREAIIMTKEMTGRLELATIRPIPLDQRHGTYGDLFTICFGSNLMLLTIVTGGLAVTVFGLSFAWAVVGLAVGNLVGAVFMALHAAQGPTLGVPQMVQTRGQFGSFGSLLVVGIVILMYVGFLASNLVLGGQALATLVPGMSDAPGIALVGALSVIATIYGYDLIHAYARLMSYLSGAVLALTAVWIVWIHGLPADFCPATGSIGTGCSGSFPPRHSGKSPMRRMCRTTRATCRRIRARGPHSGRATGAARSGRFCPWCSAPSWGWLRRRATWWRVSRC